MLVKMIDGAEVIDAVLHAGVIIVLASSKHTFKQCAYMSCGKGDFLFTSDLVDYALRNGYPLSAEQAIAFFGNKIELTKYKQSRETIFGDE